MVPEMWHAFTWKCFLRASMKRCFCWVQNSGSTIWFSYLRWLSDCLAWLLMRALWLFQLHSHTWHLYLSMVGFYSIFGFRGSVSCSPQELQTHYVFEDDLDWIPDPPASTSWSAGMIGLWCHALLIHAEAHQGPGHAREASADSASSPAPRKNGFFCFLK